MAGIEIVDLKKSYWVEKKELPVLTGINLTVPERQITVILGRSGCGKTTLLRLAGGLERPDSGQILCGDSHRMAFVFQEPRLMPWLTVERNISFGLRKQEKKENAGRIREIIRTVGLEGFEKAYPSQLSGGMKQRAALARALAYRPSFIMMDEPFAALDYFTREGGTFTVATGRAHPTFAPHAGCAPINAPVVLSNGSALYDFQQGRMLKQTFLPQSAPEDLGEEELASLGAFASTAASLSTQHRGGIPSIRPREEVLRSLEACPLPAARRVPR